ncbi:unnamed protein product [Oppiella nova]|uniref:Uncharacterized protein n=1 Tax=Oppiella nova TaxID=334625 RepID=A0A7R9LBN5_9ACAR|nr:unnamed protein product [Oppiella nova]CAG2161940.1 unnamed protein product [Oppiella nova]
MDWLVRYELSPPIPHEKQHLKQILTDRQNVYECLIFAAPLACAPPSPKIPNETRRTDTSGDAFVIFALVLRTGVGRSVDITAVDVTRRRTKLVDLIGRTALCYSQIVVNRLELNILWSVVVITYNSDDWEYTYVRRSHSVGHISCENEGQGVSVADPWVPLVVPLNILNI